MRSQVLAQPRLACSALAKKLHDTIDGAHAKVHDSCMVATSSAIQAAATGAALAGSISTMKGLRAVILAFTQASAHSSLSKNDWVNLCSFKEQGGPCGAKMSRARALDVTSRSTKNDAQGENLKDFSFNAGVSNIYDVTT